MDYPRDVILQKAQEAINNQEALQRIAHVYFKFTCPHCGTRCTFEEPDVLFERGACNKCGADEPVTQAGFMLHVIRKP